MRRWNSPGCPCCQVKHDFCYYFCKACNEHYSTALGTATDTNGTWTFRFTPGETSFQAAGNFRYFRFGPSDFLGDPACKVGRVEYFIQVMCGLQDGKVSARVYVGVSDDCNFPDPTLTFIHYPEAGATTIAS